jgi:hypothetical protein
MPYGFGFFCVAPIEPSKRVGRPKRDRGKVKAGRKAAKRR